MWINDKLNGDLDKVKMSVEMISSQILGKRFSEFPNGSQTHDLPELRSFLHSFISIYNMNFKLDLTLVHSNCSLL